MQISMKKELTNGQKKEWAKMVYMQDGLNFQEIATKVGISRVTIGKWAKDGNWELYKAALSTTREDQVRTVYLQLAAMNKTIAEREGNKFPTSAEADAIRKLTAAINDMEKDFGIDVVMGVTKKLLVWMRRRNPEQAKELSFLIDEFIQEKLR